MNFLLFHMVQVLFVDGNMFRVRENFLLTNCDITANKLENHAI